MCSRDSGVCKIFKGVKTTCTRYTPFSAERLFFTKGSSGPVRFLPVDEMQNSCQVINRTNKYSRYEISSLVLFVPSNHFVCSGVLLIILYSAINSHDLRLGMDGMLLALCDHGFERSG